MTGKKTWVAVDWLKEDLWSCANIYSALNEKRLIGRQEGQ